MGKRKGLVDHDHREMVISSMNELASNYLSQEAQGEAEAALSGKNLTTDDKKTILTNAAVCMTLAHKAVIEAYRAGWEPSDFDALSQDKGLCRNFLTLLRGKHPLR